MREPFVSIGLLVLRVVPGGLLLYSHGWNKLAHFGQKAATFSDPLHVGSRISLALAVFAEVFCAAAVILGIGTRFAAVPIVVMLLVAAFVVHAHDPFAKQEFALIYAAPFVTLALTGGGRYALERHLGVFRKRGG